MVKVTAKLFTLEVLLFAFLEYQTTRVSLFHSDINTLYKTELNAYLPVRGSHYNPIMNMYKV